MQAASQTLTIRRSQLRPLPSLEDRRLSALPTQAEGLERVLALAGALADAVDLKAHYHPSHTRAVARISQLVAANLNLCGSNIFRLQIAGLLHDVGKLQIPDSILLKPDKLNPSEYEAIKRHPVLGHDMLLSLGLPDEARWVLHHHERRDGTGYPTGLQGEAIPLGSRILHVADAFDCMTTRRVYRAPVTPAAAMRELYAHTDDQFDGTVVQALEQALADRKVRQRPS